MAFSTVVNRMQAFFLAALMLVWIFSSISVPTAFAQTERDDEVAVCSITGFPQVAFSGPGVRVDDQTVSGSLELINTSAHEFPEVMVTLGFVPVGAEVSSHVIVVQERRTLRAGASEPIDFSFDASALPAGAYRVVTAASQGDFAAALHALARDEAAVLAQTITKTAAAAPTIAQEVVINEVPWDATEVAFSEPTPLTFSVSSENLSADAVFEGALEMVLTRGQVPAGSAVSESASDALRLLPAGTPRQSELVARAVEEGVFTFYAAVLNDSLQPLLTIPVRFGDAPGDTGFSYLLGLGVTRDQDAAIASACVAPVASEEQPQLTELSLAAGERARTVAIGWSSQRASAGVDLTLDDPTDIYELVAAVLHPDWNSAVTRQPGMSEADARTDQFQATPRIVAQELEVSYTCTSDECRATARTDEPVVPVENVTEKNYWMYYAIGGVALLVVLIILLVLVRKNQAGADDEYEMTTPKGTFKQ